MVLTLRENLLSKALKMSHLSSLSTLLFLKAFSLLLGEGWEVVDRRQLSREAFGHWKHYLH